MTKRSEQFRYLALTVILSVGAGLIWAVVFGCGLEIIKSIATPGNVREYLVFKRDGTPIIQTYGGNYEVMTFHALDGTPLEITQDDLGYRSPLMESINQRKLVFSPPWSKRIGGLSSDYYGPEAWYIICDDNLQSRGYLVGYNKMAKARVGYIGRNGFRPDEPPRDEQFSLDGQTIAQWGIRALIIYGVDSMGRTDVNYLLSEDGLLRIDAKERTVKNVWKETDLISAAMSYKPQADAGKTLHEELSSRTILLRTPDRVTVLDSSAKEIQTYPLPAELHSGSFTFVPLQDGRALVQKSPHNRQRTELLWIDTAGKVVERKHLDLNSGSQFSKTTHSITGSLIMPSIGIIGGVFVCYPWAPAEADSLGYWAALGKGLHIYWPMLLFLFVICVIPAVACYRRQRKYGLPWTWFWTGFVLFFGLPAYLGYLAHRFWPARLPCPSCDKPTPRDREACFFCKQDFPAPVAKGIEVFT
ncbi:MAG: hypothetical protein JXM70_08750 [Pirellulales bacterium]|nr:hypothetical protein [Pirellulales bacterium]